MGLGTEVRVPVGGSTVVGCAPVSCVPVHTPASSGGRCCTHARMDMCATGMCSCKHVWSMCVHACEHAQACTVQCIVATRVRVCTCQCIRAVVSVCVCVCSTVVWHGCTHALGSFWMSASVTAGNAGPGGECGCSELHVPHDGAGCPGDPAGGPMGHSWSAFPLEISNLHSLYLCLCPVFAPWIFD